MTNRSETVNPGVFDRGIPGEIIGILRTTFVGLDIFESDKSLRDFIDKECPNLSSWKYQIMEANNPTDRASFLIHILCQAVHIHYGNVLLLFLGYLEDKKNCDFSDVWKKLDK